MNILFSPIGNSDPVCHQHDGPWLHICRNAPIDKAILFLSATMCEYEKDHQRYSRSMELMNKWLVTHQKATVDLDLHMYSDLHQPNDSDTALPLLEHELRSIHDGYPDAVIYLNANSGTPAIKSALELLYHYLPYHFVLCHVPAHKEDIMSSRSGSRENVPADYDPDLGWETNFDNEDDAQNRLVMTDSAVKTSMGTRLELMQIQRLVSHKEYHAAKLMLQQLPVMNNNQLLADALQGAVYRMQWNTHMAGTFLAKAKWPDASLLCRREKDPLFQAAEAILTIQIAYERNDIGDMLRRLTPIIVLLAQVALDKKGIKTDLFIHLDDHNKLCIYQNDFVRAYPDIYEALRADTKIPDIFETKTKAYVATWYLLHILSKVEPDCKEWQILTKLREMEEKARNSAAHSLTAVDPNWMKKHCDYTPKEMLDYLHDLVVCLDHSLSKQYWTSYNYMSDYINQLIHLI